MVLPVVVRLRPLAVYKVIVVEADWRGDHRPPPVAILVIADVYELVVLRNDGPLTSLPVAFGAPLVRSGVRRAARRRCPHHQLVYRLPERRRCRRLLAVLDLDPPER